MHNRKRSTIAPNLLGRRGSVMLADPAAKSPRQQSANPLRLRTLLCTTPKTNLAGGGTVSLDAAGITSSATTVTVGGGGRRQRFEFDAAVPLDEVFCSTSSTTLLDELRTEILEGQNTAILSFNSGRGQSALWGNPSCILRPCVTEVFRNLAESDRTFEMMLSMFVISEGRVKDLLTEGTKLHKPSVTFHAATGPRCLGMQYTLITSIQEFDRMFEQGRQAFFNDKKSSSTLTVSLVLKQSLISPSGLPHILLSSLLVSDVGDRCSFFSKLLEGTAPPEIQTMFSAAIGGNCFSVAVCCAPEDEESSSAILALNTLQKLGNVNSAPRRRSVVEDIVTELRDQLTSLREKLSNPSIDGGVRQRIEKEVVGKEMNLQELDASLARAFERQVVTSELLRLNEANTTTERKMQRALDAASSERYKRFAQAFRAAFATSTNTIRHGQREAELIETLRNMTEERDRLQHQCLGYENDNSRLRFQLASHESETERLSKLCDELTIKVEQLQSEVAGKDEALMQSEMHCQRAQFSERLDATERSTHTAKLEADLVVQRKQLVEANTTIGKLLQKSHHTNVEEEVQRSQFENTERVKLSNMTKRLEDTEQRLKHAQEDNALLRHRLQESQTTISELSADLSKAIERQHQIMGSCQDAILKQKTLFSIERDAYIDLLSEGRGFLAELQNYRSLFIRTPSAYRGGQEELTSWLAAIGLESMLSTLIAEGFDTLHAVSVITEADLVRLKVLAGNRRKFLSATSELSRRLDAAYGHSMSAFFERPSARRKKTETGEWGSITYRTTQDESASDLEACHSGGEVEWRVGKDARKNLSEPFALDALLEEFDTWLHDFNESVLAESDASDQFVFTL